MEKRKIEEIRRLRLEQLLRKDFIPLFAGRPKREQVINQDDIVDVRIALGTTRSVQEFVNLLS